MINGFEWKGEKREKKRTKPSQEKNQEIKLTEKKTKKKQKQERKLTEKMMSKKMKSRNGKTNDGNKQQKQVGQELKKTLISVSVVKKGIWLVVKVAPSLKSANPPPPVFRRHKLSNYKN
jgi:hypothetical protein